MLVFELTPPRLEGFRLDFTGTLPFKGTAPVKG
jgi:hypothetical protein